MAKVTYNPGEDMPNRTSLFGYDFDGGRNGQPTEIPEGRALNKLRAMQPDKGEGTPGTAGFVPWFSIEEDAPVEQVEGYTAKHKGRGVYAVVKGDADVVDGLTKDEAAAFNAMSDDDKSAWVAKALDDDTDTPPLVVQGA